MRVMPPTRHDLVDLAIGDTRILQGRLTRVDRALDEVFNERFQLGAGDFQVEVFRTRRVCRDEGQVHFIGRRAGEFLLGLFSLFLQTLESQLVLAKGRCRFPF